MVCLVNENYMCSDDSNLIVSRCWMETQKGWMYFDENGYALASQWIYLGHKWYYLKSSGAMACNEKLTVDGVQYQFDASGKWIK